MIVHSNNNRNCVTGRRWCWSRRGKRKRKGVSGDGKRGMKVVARRDILARVGEVLESMGGRHSTTPPLDATTRGGGATLTLLAARAYSIEHAPAFQRLSGIILGTRYPSFVHPSGFEVRFSFSRERNASIGFSHTPCEVGDPCRGSRVLILVRFPPGWDRLDERASKLIDFVSPFLFQTKIFHEMMVCKRKSWIRLVPL